MTNPLLADNMLPAFSKIKHQHIMPAIKKQLHENRQFLEKVLRDVALPSWESIIEPLAEQNDKLTKLWSPVGHMNSVLSSDKFRSQHDACTPLLAEYASEYGKTK